MTANGMKVMPLWIRVLALCSNNPYTGTRVTDIATQLQSSRDAVLYSVRELRTVGLAKTIQVTGEKHKVFKVFLTPSGASAAMAACELVDLTTK